MKRKAKRKACKRCGELTLELANSNSKMFALETANADLESRCNQWLMRWDEASNILAHERRAFAEFYHDIQVIRSQGAHALCGATWIRADVLDAACKKYAEATEKL